MPLLLNRPSEDQADRPAKDEAEVNQFDNDLNASDSRRAGDNKHTEGSGAMPKMSDDLIGDFVQLFKLLSDETRLRILVCLSQRTEIHVRALCDILKQSQPAVSHHLALLRVAGLIEPRREGKHNFYRLKGERFQTLLDTIMQVSGKDGGEIRIEDYVPSYSPE